MSALGTTVCISITITAFIHHYSYDCVSARSSSGEHAHVPCVKLLFGLWQDLVLRSHG